MIHFAFYVPKNFLEVTKAAVFEAGAGRIGNYDSCCFETRGQGQFRPREGSKPYLGSQELLERVEEIKVEMVLHEEDLEAVIAALKKSHPYETPAYYAIKTLG
jgi:hypothetical protein